MMCCCFSQEMKIMTIMQRGESMKNSGKDPSSGKIPAAFLMIGGRTRERRKIDHCLIII